jgi:hypothetical protein
MAAPVDAGGYRIGVLVANNMFGLAIGFFKAVVPVPRLPAATAEVVPYPMYLADRSIESGQWPVIGHDERLLDRFPARTRDLPSAGLAGETAPRRVRRGGDGCRCSPQDRRAGGASRRARGRLLSPVPTWATDAALAGNALSAGRWHA